MQHANLDFIVLLVQNLLLQEQSMLSCVNRVGMPLHLHKRLVSFVPLVALQSVVLLDVHLAVLVQLLPLQVNSIARFVSKGNTNQHLNH